MPSEYEVRNITITIAISISTCVPDLIKGCLFVAPARRRSRPSRIYHHLETTRSCLRHHLLRLIESSCCGKKLFVYCVLVFLFMFICNFIAHVQSLCELKCARDILPPSDIAARPVEVETIHICCNQLGVARVESSIESAVSID